MIETKAGRHFRRRSTTPLEPEVSGFNVFPGVDAGIGIGAHFLEGDVWLRLEGGFRFELCARG